MFVLRAPGGTPRSSWGLAGVAALGWEPAPSGVGCGGARAVKSL